MSRDRKFWESLLASVLREKPWSGNRSRGGALIPSDRRMPPRTGDYGAGWAGSGIEDTARLTPCGLEKLNYVDISLDQFCSPMEYCQPAQINGPYYTRAQRAAKLI